MYLVSAVQHPTWPAAWDCVGVLRDGLWELWDGRTWGEKQGLRSPIEHCVRSLHYTLRRIHVACFGRIASGFWQADICVNCTQ